MKRLAAILLLCTSYLPAITVVKPLLQKGLELSQKKSSPLTEQDISQELLLDLKNPTFQNGILSTYQGGVVKGDDLRIQAENIQYFRPKETSEHKIIASGNLVFQYRGRVYIGEVLEYDFTTQRGVINQGKTFASPFYIGGEKIFLFSDGSYEVEEAFLTTCENIDSSWTVQAGKLNVIDQTLLSVKDVYFRFFKIPLWLPSFKMSLKKFYQPIIRYTLTWDKGAGPRAGMRVQLFTLQNFLLYGRLEYRLRKGFGGAIETDYLSEDKRAKFVTKSYLATDILPTDPERRRRYRIQGEYRSTSPTDKTKMDLTWDKYSDVLMPGDFKTEDFEINTAKKTGFTLRHQEKDFIGIVDVRPKVNGFDTVKEKLPSGFINTRPYLLGERLGLLLETWAGAGLVKLNYSDDLSVDLTDFHAIRLETQSQLTRTFSSQYFSLTPSVGVVGIYYDRNAQDERVGLGALKYGCNLKTSLFRSFQKWTHWFEPYIFFEGLSDPTAQINDHYIFSIEDGYDQIYLFRTGMKNNLYGKSNLQNPFTFLSEVYFNAFIGDRAFGTLIPKLYFNMEFEFPFLQLLSESAWNFRFQSLDFSNLKVKYTINENAAMSIEARYRSKYDWRKADHQNFILDVARKERELLRSPLSDRRFTLLTHFFFRFSPFWTCHIRSHHGWLRKKEPPYNELKIDLYTPVSTSWNLRLSYQHLQKDDRFDLGLELINR